MARKKAEVIPAPAPRPTGRPSIFTQELWDRVLCLIEEGQTIRDIAAMADMPAWDTIRRWIRNDETLSSQYRRAREEATDAMEAEILADARTVNADNASAIKVRADIIRWAMSRRAPKKYGDKITQEHTGADGGPLEFTEIRRVVVDVPKKD
ncbi:terminase small subunit-like protein [Gluconobacter albidus]|uniref:Terminase n=1 Tax=Gluconobacter albidus TaxID=318683 RepID=A0AAW3QYK3_9PROT|nr:hypothetical protein [Gluconobacter albidus]KXV39478.1 hypothetical protein AD941_05170 [Gluconobacter albidus]MBS1029467.1 hypothetical protein [Gluconobacter albidus]GBQ90885.1 hypothetical protein AA3250_2155 [Gluconobacter albidus NBRC 3250]GLQ69377.1 hypothetical protein GCM10007866_18280 [Gluconobacter albidus]